MCVCLTIASLFVHVIISPSFVLTQLIEAWGLLLKTLDLHFFRCQGHRGDTLVLLCYDVCLLFSCEDMDLAHARSKAS